MKIMLLNYSRISITYRLVICRTMILIVTDNMPNNIHIVASYLELVSGYSWIGLKKSQPENIISHSYIHPLFSPRDVMDEFTASWAPSPVNQCSYFKLKTPWGYHSSDLPEWRGGLIILGLTSIKNVFWPIFKRPSEISYFNKIMGFNSNCTVLILLWKVYYWCFKFWLYGWNN